MIPGISLLKHSLRVAKRLARNPFLAQRQNGMFRLTANGDAINVSEKATIFTIPFTSNDSQCEVTKAASQVSGLRATNETTRGSLSYELRNLDDNSIQGAVPLSVDDVFTDFDERYTTTLTRKSQVFSLAASRQNQVAMKLRSAKGPLWFSGNRLAIESACQTPAVLTQYVSVRFSWFSSKSVEIIENMIAKDRETIAKDRETIAKDHETIAKDRETIEKNRQVIENLIRTDERQKAALAQVNHELLFMKSRLFPRCIMEEFEHKRVPPKVQQKSRSEVWKHIEKNDDQFKSALEQYQFDRDIPIVATCLYKDLSDHIQNSFVKLDSVVVDENMLSSDELNLFLIIFDLLPLPRHKLQIIPKG